LSFLEHLGDIEQPMDERIAMTRLERLGASDKLIKSQRVGLQCAPPPPAT
jgi:hypothetical protein